MASFITTTRLMDYVIPTKSEEYIEQEWFKTIYCFNGDYFNFLILALFNSSFFLKSIKSFYKYFSCLF